MFINSVGQAFATKEKKETSATLNKTVLETIAVYVLPVLYVLFAISYFTIYILTCQ